MNDENLVESGFEEDDGQRNYLVKLEPGTKYQYEDAGSSFPAGIDNYESVYRTYGGMRDEN